MKLNLKKLDDLVKELGDNAPAALFQDISLFNPANLKKNDQARPAGYGGTSTSLGNQGFEGDEADVIGKLAFSLQ